MRLLIMLAVAFVSGCGTLQSNESSNESEVLSASEIETYYSRYFPVQTNTSPRLTIFPPSVITQCEQSVGCGRAIMTFPVSVKPYAGTNSVGIVNYQVIVDSLSSGDTFYLNPIAFGGDDSKIPMLYRETAKHHFETAMKDHLLVNSKMKAILPKEEVEYFKSSDMKGVEIQ